MNEYPRLMELGRLAVEAGNQARAATAFGIAALYASSTDEYTFAVVQHVTALGVAEQHDFAFAAAAFAAERIKDRPEAALLGLMAALSAGSIGRFTEGLEQARQAWPDLSQEQRARLVEVYPELGARGNRLPPWSPSGDVN